MWKRPLRPKARGRKRVVAGAEGFRPVATHANPFPLFLMLPFCMSTTANHNADSIQTTAQITAQIKDCALRVGFSLVGVAKAEPLETEMERFSDWLARGFHGGSEGAMTYMERNMEKRRDVREILPECRSVIVVAQNYYHPDPAESTSPTANPDAERLAERLAEQQQSETQNETQSGMLSRYARGDDYHDVIPPKLEAVCEEIKRLVPGAATRVYTDTGAILEKQWAVRAGLGWQGKHSNIISREIGSWFFLGVILTTAELLYDTPQADFCGTCTACMQACPTGAIVEPFVVDARRCLPYWTIETKPQHEIPPAIADAARSAKNMTNGTTDAWLFGCDTCQDVCPWNRFQQQSAEERFAPRFGETALELERVLAMTQEEFSTRFRKSPVKRTKLAGLQRNARALASARDDEPRGDEPQGDEPQKH
jgi:epoxyqueuosine reductase